MLLWSHTNHNWNWPLHVFFALEVSDYLRAHIDHNQMLSPHVSIICQMTFLRCFVLTLIAIKFDVHMFWFFMNPNILLVRCFHVLIFCALSENSFVFLGTHIDHIKVWSPHVLIECALSDFFWFLLCTHIDHNQIWCPRA